MSKKAKTYTAQEKAKVAMEAIRGELTMAQLSSQYGVHATQINRWKREGVEAMVAGFTSKSKAIDKGQSELISQLYQQIGHLTMERDWLKKNLQSLALGVKKPMIEDNSQISIKRQCSLLGPNRSSYYSYPCGIKPYEQEILNRMDEIFTEHPYYGNRRMMHVLRNEGFMVGRKRIRHYYQLLGIEAIYPKMK